MGHGCSIGSEMSGGVEDVYIWDCDFEKSIFGITVKATKKRGGFVRNFVVKNCIAPRIMVRTDPYNDDGVAAATVPVFENFLFENVKLSGCYWEDEVKFYDCPAISLTGFDVKENYLKNVRFVT